MLFVEHADCASIWRDVRAWMHTAVHGFVATKSEAWQELNWELYTLAQAGVRPVTFVASKDEME
jgi:hypothetical protein